MPKKKTSEDTPSKLNNYLDSPEFDADIRSHFAKEKDKQEKFIAFSQTALFLEILKFIKDRKSQSLNRDEKQDNPEI